MKALLLVCCLAAVQAYPPPPFARPFPPPPMIPGFELLPADVQTQLKTSIEDPNLGWQERHEKIMDIMENLPDEIKAKLPPPPGFERLPADVQEKLKAIHMDKTLTWQQKQQKVREIIDNLPENIKRLLPIPPPPPGFELIPDNVKAQMRVIHEDKTLTPQQRIQKIHELIESLPAEIKSKLPPPMPMPMPPQRFGK